MMVKNISLNVEIVSLNIQHNFLIPEEMNVDTATSLIVKTVSDEYPGVKRAPGHMNLLLHAGSGKILDTKCSFKQLGISQGERLILM